MKEVKYLSTMPEIKAYSDPFRMMILKHYYKSARPSTVKQIADDMNEVPAKVHYHVKKMYEAELLKLVHTKEVNGILAKFYEPTAKQFEITHHHLRAQECENFSAQVSHSALTEVFDDHKQAMVNAINSGESESNYVFASEVYLTKEEYKMLTDTIEKLHQSKGRKHAKKTPYKFLTTLTEIG